VLQGQAAQTGLVFLTLKMEPLHSFETPGTTCSATHCHISQDMNLLVVPLLRSECFVV